MPDHPLTGVRVIEVGIYMAGPFCAMQLADLGADVIKVEEPGRGDIARVNLRDRPDSDSLFFLFFNANKRSLTLNQEPARERGLRQAGQDRRSLVRSSKSCPTCSRSAALKTFFRRRPDDTGK